MRFPILLVVVVSAICAIPVLAVAMGRGWVSDKPPVHWNPNMDTQEKGKPFRHDQSGVFKDGRYMQTPPPGTVARGYLHDDDQLTNGVDAEGKPLAKLPDAFTADVNTVARGKNRFAIYCAPCHGKNADGKGLVVPRDGGHALAVPPPSFMDPRLVGMPAGSIYKAIHEGVNNGNMPSYALQIPEKDRWAIVAFLCTLETGEADPTKACANKKPQEAKGPGDAVAIAKGCYACHTTDGSPKIGPSWKGIYGKTEKTDKGDIVIDDNYIAESIKTPTAKIVAGFPPVMPPMALTDQELKDVTEWIKSLK